MGGRSSASPPIIFSWPGKTQRHNLPLARQIRPPLDWENVAAGRPKSPPSTSWSQLAVVQRDRVTPQGACSYCLAASPYDDMYKVYCWSRECIRPKPEKLWKVRTARQNLPIPPKDSLEFGIPTFPFLPYFHWYIWYRNVSTWKICLQSETDLYKME